MTVGDIIEMIQSHAPEKTACEWDNCGLCVGRSDAEVEKVLVAIDVSQEVAEEAYKKGAQLIVTHHPLIFDPIKSVTDKTNEGRIIMYLIEHGIALYSAHTNMDAAPGGINDYLCKLYGLENVCPFEIIYEENGEKYGLCRVGALPQSMKLKALAELIGKKLGAESVSFVGDGEKEIKRVAVCSGGGGSMVSPQIAEIADVYITGDVKYSNARNADAFGLCVIVANHYDTEIFTKDIFCEWISGVEVIKSCTDYNVLKEIVLK